MDQSNLENAFKEHLKADQRRLDRIEEKIDKLSEFVVQLARVEEKIEILEYSREKMGERLGTIENIQIAIQINLDAQTRILQGITRLGWVLVTAAVTAAAGIVLFGGG